MITKENNLYEKYKGYSAEDLLLDEYFISSVIEPTKESTAFWKKIVHDGIVHSDNYHLACYLVDSMQVDSCCISTEEIDELWGDIKEKNACYAAMKRKKIMRHILLWSLSGVASLFLFLYYGYSEKPMETAGLLIEDVKAPEVPVTDIHLVFSDDETMALDGQDAEIVYDKEGVAINNKNTKLKKKQVNKDESVMYNQLIVPKGKRSTLVFEDGSKMWINAGTRVVYPVVFAEDKREIYIDGEAYFDISREERRPFIVKTETFTIDVLGTSFNIMAYEKDFVQHVVLVSGTVKVHSKDQDDAILSPDDMYLSDNGSAQIKKVDVSDYISWTSGMYQYKSDRLDVIMKRLSRYYGKEIICEPDVAHLRFSGKLDLKDDLNAVLRGISRTSPVYYQLKNDSYMITNK
ncbi:MAG: FecR domain-containing protein [Tannerellaceae bacterium]|jgi:hypothetical protein|nr:FecR domain-containing protein [Tannerellaceae bacterium]